ncbi:MAG: hypothetical protein ACP5O3_01605 [Candidatus Micrarchaeia archaeon]|jgi:putative mRNA 3-end processing factor
MLYRKGSKTILEASGRRIALDCAAKGALASFVSHAHSDHAQARKAAKLLATPATIDLMKARNYDSPAQATQELVEGEFKARLENAGHVLGSAQLYAEWDGTSFGYTADFKLSPSLTCKPATVMHSEVLLMEATYGSPEFVFPDREKTAREIAAWTKKHFEKGEITILGGYALGKAQELIKILNECGITPIVNNAVERICRVYVKHGVSLDFVPSESSEGEQAIARGKKFVAVLNFNEVTPVLAQRLTELHGRRVACATATGWALGSRSTDYFKGFCLSDHADFNELTRYAEESGAKKIFTTHGFAEELAAALRKKGLNASPLPEFQESLSNWC